MATLSAASLQPLFGTRPQPRRQDETFINHWFKTKMFINQSGTGYNVFFKLAEAMHLLNVADNKTFLSMDENLLQHLSIPMINRLEKVAEIVHKHNPWATASNYRTFTRTVPTQDPDTVIADIAQLAEDIQDHYQRHSKGEFVPTVKFESDRQPTDAIATIDTFFGKYSTFDAADFRNLKSFQEMTPETYEATGARLKSYLLTIYPEVPRLQQADTLGMIILIQEHYALHSDSSPQHNVQKFIADYGVNNNVPPAVFADTIHEQMHIGFKLNKSIDEQFIIGLLNRHLQAHSQIDSLIRSHVTTMINQGNSLESIISAMSGFTIRQACATGFSTSEPIIAASTTTTATTPASITPSTLHNRQKEAQQGLRPAASHSDSNRLRDVPRQGEQSQHRNIPTNSRLRICHMHLNGLCEYGKDCKYLHVENVHTLRSQGYVIPHLRPATAQLSQTPGPRFREPRFADKFTAGPNHSQTTHSRGGLHRDSRFTRSDFPPSNSRYADVRYASSERYPYHTDSYQERQGPSSASSSARVGFVPDQYRGQHRNQSPGRFQAQYAHPGQQGSDYNRASSPGRNLRLRDEYHEQRSNTPSRRPSDNRFQHEHVRSDLADEFEHMTFRPETPACKAISSTASAGGVLYNDTRNWQITQSRTSFANTSTREDTPQSIIPTQTDEMMADFFDAAAGAQGPVHGCMLHIRRMNSNDQISTPSNGWPGTSTIWNAIRNLQFDQSINIECLLKNSPLF